MALAANSKIAPTIRDHLREDPNDFATPQLYDPKFQRGPWDPYGRPARLLPLRESTKRATQAQRSAAAAAKVRCVEDILYLPCPLTQRHSNAPYIPSSSSQLLFVSLDCCRWPPKRCPQASGKRKKRSLSPPETPCSRSTPSPTHSRMELLLRASRPRKKRRSTQRAKLHRKLRHKQQLERRQRRRLRRQRRRKGGIRAHRAARGMCAGAGALVVQRENLRSCLATDASSLLRSHDPNALRRRCV
jgi:hypothetical protein